MPNPAQAGCRSPSDAGLLVVAAVAVGAGILCYIVKGREVFLATLSDDLGLLASVLPKVAAGVLLSGLLTVLLPRDKVARWMGARSGVRGLVLAGAVGALLPGGPMMAFPLGVALRSAGADIGTVVAFLTGWGLLSVNRTLVWELSFFPHDFVYLRYALSLALPVLLGLAARLFGARDAAGRQGGGTANSQGRAE